MIQPITLPAVGSVDDLRLALTNTLNTLIKAINAQSATQSTTLDMANNRLVNLAQPVAPTDAATVAWVQAQIKASVRT